MASVIDRVAPVAVTFQAATLSFSIESRARPMSCRRTGEPLR
jgi:hypothetical protein